MINVFKTLNSKRVLIFLCTLIAIFAIIATSFTTKKYHFKEGDIAKVNVTAPREIKDELSTEARMKQEIDSLPPQYDKDVEVKNNAIAHIDALFMKAMELKDVKGEDKDKISKLRNEAPIYLSDNDFYNLIKMSKDDLKSLQNFMDRAFTEIYSKNIENKSEEVAKAQQMFNSEISNTSFDKSVKDAAINIANNEIKPNYFYDDKKTQEYKNDAIKKISPVMIKKDQIIVKEGEPVTKYQLSILKELGLLNDSSKFMGYVYIDILFFAALVLFVQWAYLYKYFKEEIFESISKLILVNTLTCIALLLTRTLAILSPFLIPLGCIPMVLTLLTNHKVALTISSLNCILISAVVGFNVEITILAILNAVIGTVVLNKVQQRNDIVYSSLYLAIIGATITIGVGFLISGNVIQVLTEAGFVAIAGIISGILTVGFLPAFESAFDIVTTIKLLELSNPNSPLLKKLLVDAPGTYHHSIMVANLAELATEEVGGNPVLARVAAYYHDVGKIKRPYFFKENQMGNDNPHDKITANLSTLIITSHVKDGISLAKEYKIPKAIQDIIEQHHGNSLVKYFYIMEKNNSTNPEEIKEEDFRYPCNTPVTKEAGIIMLADGVEAAVRSIKDPTKGKIEEMINNIVKDRLNDGQLDHCDLTLKDIDKIKNSFIKVLLGIYHKRIEYPVERKENEIMEVK